MNAWQTAVTIAVIALATLLTRFAPFWFIPKDRPVPEWLAYLGRVLPCAVMGLLVVYCLKDVSLTAVPHGLPEGIGVATVVLLHLWKKNTLLSVGVGTAVYMVLVQAVFV